MWTSKLMEITTISTNKNKNNQKIELISNVVRVRYFERLIPIVLFLLAWKVRDQFAFSLVYAALEVQSR